MNLEQQRIKLAEWDGWTNYRITPSGAIWGFPAVPRIVGATKTKVPDLVPDYLSDLNAVHELEKRLTHEQFDCYEIALNDLYLTGKGNHPVHATAAQRCEALLKTLGLWEDAK